MAFKLFGTEIFRRHKMIRLLVLGGTILAIVVTALSDDCNLPPSQWCTSEEIAKKCQVYDQCRIAMGIDPFAGPVNLTLYFESLCPDCKDFFAKQLYHTWEVLGADVLNLTLVPYGNADEEEREGTWIFACQHGKQECIGNVIETCAIDILDNISVYMPFIHCMEELDDLPGKAAGMCADKFGIDIAPIMACANGPKGNLLEHEMAVQTDALDPPHRYVPWVTINGVHTERMERMAESDLLGLICETYRGDPPKACMQLRKCGSLQCEKNITMS